MNWFRKMMAGRYGSDQLSVALMAVSVLLVLVYSFTRLNLILYIGYIPILISILRMFSKNLDRRRTENYKFVLLVSPIYSRGGKIIKRLKDSKEYRYFKCPNCKAQLRVPKGKGKVDITCPKCKTGFSGKT